jgi:hypothetical protein
MAWTPVVYMWLQSYIWDGAVRWCYRKWSRVYAQPEVTSPEVSCPCPEPEVWYAHAQPEVAQYPPGGTFSTRSDVRHVAWRGTVRKSRMWSCAHAQRVHSVLLTIVVVPLRITDRATGSDVTPEVGVSRRFWGCFGICCVVLPRSHCVFFFFFFFLVQVWQCFFMKFT